MSPVAKAESGRAPLSFLGVSVGRFGAQFLERSGAELISFLFLFNFFFFFFVLCTKRGGLGEAGPDCKGCYRPDVPPLSRIPGPVTGAGIRSDNARPHRGAAEISACTTELSSARPRPAANSP